MGRRHRSPWLLALVLLGAVCACSDRPRRNPLDPQARDPEASHRPLEAVAGSSQVLLRWDYRWFTDLLGYRVYRRVGRGSFAPFETGELGPQADRYVDRDVVDGRTYEYRLALLVRGEGERPLSEIRRATPGPQTVWAADRASGLVWRIAPDGRSAWFGQGRFGDLAAVAADPPDSACWVSDRGSHGLYRLRFDGAVEAHAADLDEPGLLQVDAAARLAWVVDQRRRRAYWFVLPAAGALVLVEADASFSEPAGLDAADGAAWVADRAAGRVLRHSARQGHLDEWRGLDRPGRLVAAGEGHAWVLARDGTALLRLDPGGVTAEMPMPMARANALAADGAGGCWLAGEGGVIRVDGGGEVRDRWTDLADAQDLVVDAAHGQVWVALEGALVKRAATGETLARLEGFSGLRALALDPAGP
jgi:sugar lactone lactonase YvrE